MESFKKYLKLNFMMMIMLCIKMSLGTVRLISELDVGIFNGEWSILHTVSF